MQVATYLGDTSPPLGDGGLTSPQQVPAQVCRTVSFSIIKYQEDSLTKLCQANSDSEVNYKLMYPSWDGVKNFRELAFLPGLETAL